MNNFWFIILVFKGKNKIPASDNVMGLQFLISLGVMPEKTNRGWALAHSFFIVTQSSPESWLTILWGNGQWLEVSFDFKLYFLY